MYKYGWESSGLCLKERMLFTCGKADSGAIVNA
jgi:hypothetical protein